MRNIMYNTNDINRFCAYAKCQKQVDYVKVKTGSNDPGISQKMRYSQYVNQPRVACSKLLDPLGQIVNDD
jgi:hypothetical protein